VALLATLLSGAAALEQAQAQANSNPPERLTYQGYVVDANGTVLGQNAPKNYDVVFRIFDAQTGGNVKWAEQQTVTVDKGYFSVLLGEGTAVGQPRPELSSVFAGPDTSDRYIEITVKGIGAPDATIAPRLRLLASPYAFLARNANNLVTASGQSLFSAGVGVLRISAPIQSTGGNARGNGSVDLQTTRSANDQVASGANSVLTGGLRNKASGDNSFVGAGLDNSALGISSAVVAGFQNRATNSDSFVGGGGSNFAEGYRSFVGGGGFNYATKDHSVVVGGFKNIANGINASVGGGAENNANGTTAGIGGGFRNHTTGLESFVVGGTLNTNTATRGFIGAGLNNKLTAENAVVGGGARNQALGLAGFVGAGDDNVASGVRAVVGGGGSNLASGLDSVISGGFGNEATKPNATIGGGFINKARGDHSTVAGGHNNWADGVNSTVGGGFNNWTQGGNSFVGAGESHIASGVNSAVLAGFDNLASANSSTVASGDFNVASGINSFVAGWRCEATGFESVALGRRAKSRGDGIFTYADRWDLDFAPTYANSFNVRATGGIHFYSNGVGWLDAARTGVFLAPNSSSWAFVSDRNAKKNFEDLDYKEVLEKLDKVPVTAWHYKAEANDSTKNMGPVAQEFKQTFYPGRDDKSITTLELDGVELAAIKGLREVVKEKDREIQDLKRQMIEVKALLEKLTTSSNP